MKINFGAGKQTWPDFFCIDAVQHPKASRPLDMIHAVEFDGDGINRLPLEDGCADELHSYHFIEHVYAWQAPALVGEWYRLLKPGGVLVVECPDLLKAARNLLNGGPDQMHMWPLYGDPGHKDVFMCHHWGYTPKTLQALLIMAGFERCKEKPPQTHGARLDRDMRMEARKPC